MRFTYFSFDARWDESVHVPKGCGGREGMLRGDLSSLWIIFFLWFLSGTFFVNFVDNIISVAVGAIKSCFICFL